MLYVIVKYRCMYFFGWNNSTGIRLKIEVIICGVGVL